MGDPIDFYGVLNIPKDSSPEDIRKAYKALVRRWHPDKNPPSSKKEAEAKFKAITQAYEVPSPFPAAAVAPTSCFRPFSQIFAGFLVFSC